MRYEFSMEELGNAALSWFIHSGQLKDAPYDVTMKRDKETFRFFFEKVDTKGS